MLNSSRVRPRKRQVRWPRRRICRRWLSRPCWGLLAVLWLQLDVAGCVWCGWLLVCGVLGRPSDVCCCLCSGCVWSSKWAEPTNPSECLPPTELRQVWRGPPAQPHPGVRLVACSRAERHAEQAGDGDAAAAASPIGLGEMEDVTSSTKGHHHKHPPRITYQRWADHLH